MPALSIAGRTGGGAPEPGRSRRHRGRAAGGERTRTGTQFRVVLRLPRGRSFAGVGCFVVVRDSEEAVGRHHRGAQEERELREVGGRNEGVAVAGVQVADEPDAVVQEDAQLGAKGRRFSVGGEYSQLQLRRRARRRARGAEQLSGLNSCGLTQ